MHTETNNETTAAKLSTVPAPPTTNGHIDSSEENNAERRSRADSDSPTPMQVDESVESSNGGGADPCGNRIDHSFIT